MKIMMTVLLMALSLTGIVKAVEPAAPWPAPVKGFVEPQPGEHPRLFFRKSDVPALRAKAQTDIGKRLIARLRELLGNNGEKLPEFHSDFPRNVNGGELRYKPGRFTMGHAAGYGLLYQLTGEGKYADLARQCVERVLNPELHRVTLLEIKTAYGADWWSRVLKDPRFGYKGKTDDELATVVITYGQSDMDIRYNWTRPGAGLRVGPMMLWMAMAYDLCHDGWDVAFRQRVAREILDYKGSTVAWDLYAIPQQVTLEHVVDGGGYPPGSNHYGAMLGGAGVALLAIRGDAGVDSARVDSLMARLETSVGKGFGARAMGDRGVFAEGQGPGRAWSNHGLMAYFQAARIAGGRDWMTPRPDAAWLALWDVMNCVPDAAGKPWLASFKSDVYGADCLGWVHHDYGEEGTFAHAFGMLPEKKEQGALLWLYNRTFGRTEPATFGVWRAPHSAVLAFVNWPTDPREVNPAQVLGHYHEDTAHAYHMVRQQWQNENDFLLVAGMRHAGHFMVGHTPGVMMLWGNGRREKFIPQAWRGPEHKFSGTGKTLYARSEPDGSTVFTVENQPGGPPVAFAVDFTGKSGLPGVVVIANWWSDKIAPGAVLNVGDRRWVVWAPPGKASVEPVVDGQTIRIGAQVYRFDGEKVVIGGKGGKP